jgi:hypothetical protein
LPISAKEAPTAQVSESYKNLCIFHILDGLRDGLSQFSGSSRAALLYAVRPEDPLRIYDPQHLLRGHEPRLRELYLETDDWHRKRTEHQRLKHFESIRLERLSLAGLITYGSCSQSIYYQRWFTEHHPDICSTGPTKRWMEHAAWLLAQNLTSENVLYIDTSGHVLQEWAKHAVRNYIIDRRVELIGWDSQLRVYPTLDAMLGISKTQEEGAWPRGQLVFVEPSRIPELNFQIKFREMERPEIIRHKHVRKLMQAVEHSGRKLVSDGRYIVGIAEGQVPKSSLTGDFHGSYGFLSLGDEPICSFFDGRFHSTNRRAVLVQVEEALVEKMPTPDQANQLFRIISRLVHSAEDRKHGCALVIDLGESPIRMSGQRMEEPLDLTNERYLALAKSLAKVDGALHLGRDMRLHGFACLMDGRSIASEDRARGARFNSALRFSAMHEDIMVVVVSSDRPVSIIQGGIELTASCHWKPFYACVDTPPTLEDWIKL